MDYLKVDIDEPMGSWRRVLSVMRNLVDDGCECFVTRRGFHFRHYDKPPVFSLRSYYGDDESRIYWDEVRGRMNMQCNVLFTYKVAGGEVCFERRVSKQCVWDWLVDEAVRLYHVRVRRRRKF